MRTIYRLIFDFLKQKKGEIPGWAYIVGLIVGLIALIILIYIAAKSGRTTVEQITGLE